MSNNSESYLPVLAKQNVISTIVREPKVSYVGRQVAFAATPYLAADFAHRANQHDPLCSALKRLLDATQGHCRHFPEWLAARDQYEKATGESYYQRAVPRYDTELKRVNVNHVSLQNKGEGQW